MPVTPGERLARVLDGSQAPGAGPVSFPVRAPQAKRMIACARRPGSGGASRR